MASGRSAPSSPAPGRAATQADPDASGTPCGTMRAMASLSVCHRANAPRTATTDAPSSQMRSVSATKPTPPKVAAPACSAAQTRFPNRGRRPGEPQRTGRRCGSREAPASTGTSPTPSSQDEVTGDRKTNGSAPRQSRREAEPQRCLTGWAAALSRHTGVSRDQPQEGSRVQRREGGRMHSLSWGWSRLATPRPSRDSAAG